MIIWITFAVMTAVVTAALLHPLSPIRTAVSDGGKDGARVYRDQLEELDRELAAGRIAPDDHQVARAETARRLFREADAVRVEWSSSRSPVALKLSVAAFLSIASISTYVAFGSPELPSKALQQRLDEPGQDLAILIRKTEEHLVRVPNDGRGWDVIAPIYLRTNRVADADKAYRNAIRLLGPSAIRLDGLAEAVLASSNGTVTAEARRVLEALLELQPRNPRAKYYVALASEQAGDTAEAKAAFEAIVKDSPPGAPWLPLVNEHIARNGESLAGAQSLAPAEQQQTIRDMVESLDARLKTDPDDLDGWMRLVRSYAVLNEMDRAADALDRALAAFSTDGESVRKLIAVAREYGIGKGKTE
ncbi:c-type cytochrome biogenesis protein CcmI [Rhizobium bangladeshense]|uniref:c-type cytochrome biogenesis protein CcmI n=1 Tax=Rhizobium bangladeshense TaxID=1138189 RepID=UPI0007E53F74|nr:c-type cytochrome biogenesis protein CcmI [Rhizobium bangladeshense]